MSRFNSNKEIIDHRDMMNDEREKAGILADAIASRMNPRQRELEATPHTKADSVGEFFRMVFWEQVKQLVSERERATK